MALDTGAVHISQAFFPSMEMLTVAGTAMAHRAQANDKQDIVCAKRCMHETFVKLHLSVITLQVTRSREDGNPG